MKSVGQVSQKLPQDFVDNLYSYFSPLQADRILQGFAQDRLTTLRVNTLKTDVRTVMEQLKGVAIKFDRVLWYDDALVIKNRREKDLQELAAYQQGEIYLQSLSSMLPPLLLKPQPGDRVLDIAAAPGSKTTQMAACMKNRGEIVAVEVDKIRIQRLKYNLEHQGVSITLPVCGRGERIYKDYPEYFDKVLVDAPCSGEGLFVAKLSHTYRHWQEKHVRRCAALQRKLLASGISALKPGGRLVYSTCTINPEENEMNVAWALENYPKMKLVAIKVPHSLGESALAQVGEKRLPGDLSKAVRIIPDHLMEGFFFCLLQKD